MKPILKLATLDLDRPPNPLALIRLAIYRTGDDQAPLLGAHGVWIERTDDGGGVLKQKRKALAARPPVLDRLIKRTSVDRVLRLLEGFLESVQADWVRWG
jgi:hypothetical protein